MSHRKRVFTIAGILFTVISFGTVSCGSSGPSAQCVDWDHDKVKVTVKPRPDRTYDRRTNRWVDGPTPKPYVTEYMKVECEEWETKSPTPTKS